MKFVLQGSFTSAEAIEEALKEALSQISSGCVSGVNPNWSIKLEATDTGIHTFRFEGCVEIIAKSQIGAEEGLNKLFYNLQNEYNEWYKTNIQGTYKIRHSVAYNRECPESDGGCSDDDWLYPYDFVCELNMQTENRDVALDAVYKLIDFGRWISVDQLVYEETGEVLDIEC
jgi:hypothetical protein